MRARRTKAAAHLSVEKVAYCHFFEFFSCFASRIRSRAAKPAKYENLRVFIRFDAHVVKAGINLRGCGPLTTPGFFDRLVRGGLKPPRIPFPEHCHSDGLDTIL